MWENTTPSTESPRDICAGSGPLQLGVVLVSIIFVLSKSSFLRPYHVSNCCFKSPVYVLNDCTSFCKKQTKQKTIENITTIQYSWQPDPSDAVAKLPQHRATFYREFSAQDDLIIEKEKLYFQAFFIGN